MRVNQAIAELGKLNPNQELLIACSKSVADFDQVLVETEGKKTIVTLTGETKFYKLLRKENPEPKAIEYTDTVSPAELNLMIETYCYLKENTLTIHQRSVLRALQELRRLTGDRNG